MTTKQELEKELGEALLQIGTREEQLAFYFAALRRAIKEERKIKSDMLAAERSNVKELLEALEELELLGRDQLDQSATHDGLTNCTALANARAAIAKAKGEQ